MSNIVTAADYNIYLNTSDTSSDTQKTAMITYLQDYIQTVLGLTFISATLTERYSVRPGQQTIQLRTYPVTSVTSIKCFFGTGSTDYTTLTTDSYYVNLTTGIVSIYNAGNSNQYGYDSQGFPTIQAFDQPVIGQIPSFYPGVNNHEIVYVGGNVSAPAGLKLCMFWALDYLLGKAGENPDVQAESVLDHSVTYARTNKFNQSEARRLATIFAAYANGAMLV